MCQLDTGTHVSGAIHRGSCTCFAPALYQRNAGAVYTWYDIVQLFVPFVAIFAYRVSTQNRYSMPGARNREICGFLRPLCANQIPALCTVCTVPGTTHLAICDPSHPPCVNSRPVLSHTISDTIKPICGYFSHAVCQLYNGTTVYLVQFITRFVVIFRLPRKPNPGTPYPVQFIDRFVIILRPQCVNLIPVLCTWYKSS